MTRKVALSLPEETYRRLERARKRERISRSAAVQRAIAVWLGAEDHERKVREYLAGYRKLPEGTEANTWIAAQVWSAWDEG